VCSHPGCSGCLVLVLVADEVSDGLSAGAMGGTSDVSLESITSEAVASAATVASSTSAGDALTSSSSSSPAVGETDEKKRGDDRWRKAAATDAEDGPRRKADVARSMMD